MWLLGFMLIYLGAMVEFPQAIEVTMIVCGLVILGFKTYFWLEERDEDD